MELLVPVLDAFGYQTADVKITPITSGLINGTWKLETLHEARILQRLNHQVFTRPDFVMDNLSMIAQYLREQAPDYLFPTPIAAVDGSLLVKIDGVGYFRMFDFIPDTHTVDVVTSASEAWEAAHQFGSFTAVLRDFDATRLHTTIPGFHNLSFRYQQFIQSLGAASEERLQLAGSLIEQAHTHSWIADRYRTLIDQSVLKSRVTHHDTKISNVLFDRSGKGCCVIDLDTVMSGYIISDLGDMFRTYVCPVSENETDLDKIYARREVYEAIVDGYLSSMGDLLDEEERATIFFAGSFMIYMQALRFLTDYLNGDIYYQIQYTEHNFNRSANQFRLLAAYQAMRA